MSDQQCPSSPTVSIITITFNAEQTLERTILSVAAQDYPNIEYIIVDGLSKDATMDIVHRHETTVSSVISEPDDGLYFAMNKGLHMATGQFIWFLNAGDELAQPNTVSQMIASAPNADVFYGDTVITDLDGNEIGGRRLTPPDSLTWRSFKNGMLVCHQAFVARRSLCPDYDTRFKMSADFDWCVSILKKAQNIANTHSVMVRFLDGGLTKQHIAKALKERFQIMCHHYGVLSTLFHHIPIAFRFFRFWISKGRF